MLPIYEKRNQKALDNKIMKIWKTASPGLKKEIVKSFKETIAFEKMIRNKNLFHALGKLK